jgi:hypothetical protein
MTVAVIDTLKLVKRLRETMDPKQAEAFAEALNESLGEKVATKADIEASEARLTNKLYAVGLTVVLATGVMQHFLK